MYVVDSAVMLFDCIRRIASKVVKGTLYYPRHKYLQCGVRAIEYISNCCKKVIGAIHQNTGNNEGR